MDKQNRFNVFFALIACFYSKALYQDVFLHWRKRIFLYLFLVLMICLCPFTVRVWLNFSHLVHKYEPVISAQLPTITFREGVASVEPKGVYPIYYPGSKFKLAIIDTSEASRDFIKDEALFLVSSTELKMKTKADDIKVYPYEKNYNFVFGPKELRADLHHYKHRAMLLFILFVYTLLLLLFYALYLIYALLMGVFASIVAGSIDRLLAYQANLRLTLVALTPVAYIWSLLYLFKWISLPVIAGGMLLQIAYMSYAVWSCKKYLTKSE